MPEAREPEKPPVQAPWRAGDPVLAEMTASVFAHLKPPEKIDLVEWIEANVFLPGDVSATPGRMRLNPHQRGVAETLGSAAYLEVVWLKGARVGASQLGAAFVGHHVVNDPANVLIIQPREDDARDFMRSTIEPTFAASPVLRGSLTKDDGKKELLLSRRTRGGHWVKIVPAYSPTGLRRLTARVVFADEVSAYAQGDTSEGRATALAQKRTMTFGNRKLFYCSTPTDAETCEITRLYEQSDRRIFEIPCPHCGEYFELQWRAHIRWDKTETGAHLPDSVHAICPANGCVIAEREKIAAAEAGRWRATQPNVQAIAGFRSNCLTSNLPGAAWPYLVREFLGAKDDPSLLRVFVNTILGEPWLDRPGESLDENTLAARAEPIGLQPLPADIRILVAGCDVQAWGLEVLTVGFSATQIYFLDYRTIHGDPHGEEVWHDLTAYSRQRFPHELGGTLGYDRFAADSGDGNLSARIEAWARKGFPRGCISTKGYSGNRPLIAKSSKTGLYIIGADTGKARVFALLKAPDKMRFSADLPARFYEELTAERRVTQHKHGHPRVHWEKIVGARNEALDCAVMALGARELVKIDMVARSNQLRQIATAPNAPTVIPNKWLA